MGNTASSDTKASSALQQQEASTSSCPVPEQYRSQGVFDVYGRRIDQPQSSDTVNPLDVIAKYKLDPTNQMPREPNQQPCPGQTKPLSTKRLSSTIPKGGTEGTWLYPSPQMFFNSLRRKGKGDDVQEDDMEAVVYNHNVMNEMTWHQVQMWEKLHQDTCNCPKLLRFEGKPHTQSPRALWRRLLGDTTWFDRHDWYVDRCGHVVRYVIDFYFEDSKAGSMEAFEVDVRPAVDSVEALLDRCKMSIYTTFAKYGLPCPVTGHSGTLVEQAEDNVRSHTS